MDNRTRFFTSTLIHETNQPMPLMQQATTPIIFPCVGHNAEKLSAMWATRQKITYELKLEHLSAL
jgi:hypothetical protein